MAKIEKSPDEWQQQLTPEQYRVAREKGTERPFSGDYQVRDAQGIYHCVCCYAPLFENEHKFDAGCGWPSFDRPLGTRCVGGACRYHSRYAAHRGGLFSLRRPPGPRVPRRATRDHRLTLLH